MGEVSKIICEMGPVDEDNNRRIRVEYCLGDDHHKEMIQMLSSIIRTYALKFRTSPDVVLDDLNGYVNSNAFVSVS